MVRVSSRLALTGLVLLWMTLTAVLLLVSDVLFDNGPAIATATVFAVATVTLWFVPPLLKRRSAPFRAAQQRAAKRH